MAVSMKTKDGSEFDASKRVELTDEQLERISGGEWNRADAYNYDADWANAFSAGVEVVYRDQFGVDHWCTVISWTYTEGGKISEFDLEDDYCYYYGVPASSVLILFDD